jgi:hypothetical protein
MTRAQPLDPGPPQLAWKLRNRAHDRGIRNESPFRDNSMSKYTVNIQNDSSITQYFIMFQETSTYNVSYIQQSTILDAGELGPFSSSGAILTFSVEQDIYAGVKSIADNAASLPSSPAAVGFELAGFAASQSSAYQLMQLTGTSNPTNSTAMSFSPLGLSRPTNDPSMASNTFGIVVPVYTPPSPNPYCCGLAIVKDNLKVILSNFVQANPNQTIKCTPSPIFYVAMGNLSQGTLIDDYGTLLKGAAKCDFTTGAKTITLTYNCDGTFTVKP